MEYISAAEAAEKWGVSLRQAQRLLAGGRILRAKKYGRSWMIPADAEKPTDPRREKKPPRSALFSDFARLLAATAAPLPAHDPDAIVHTVSGERERRQYEAELAYLRGDFKRAMRCFFDTEGDGAARLRICLVAIAAAISMGDYRAYTQIDTHLKNCVKDQKGKNDSVAVVAELALSTAAVSAIAPNMASEWLKKGDFHALMPQMRPFAFYLRAKYFHCTNQHEAMLAVSQAALLLSEPERGISQTGLYLRLCCAMACRALGREDEARRHLLETMELALPNGFITPFAEVVTALGGLMEQCLKQAFPAYYDAVLGQWKRTFVNWVVFHNQFTKNNITLVLSLREYHIARLVAHRVPYAQIAEQHCISVGRLKNIMQEVYGKLLISSRKELIKYIF